MSSDIIVRLSDRWLTDHVPDSKCDKFEAMGYEWQDWQFEVPGSPIDLNDWGLLVIEPEVVALLITFKAKWEVNDGMDHITVTFADAKEALMFKLTFG